jgi:hypothetical protein
MTTDENTIAELNDALDAIAALLEYPCLPEAEEYARSLLAKHSDLWRRDADAE